MIGFGFSLKHVASFIVSVISVLVRFGSDYVMGIDLSFLP